MNTCHPFNYVISRTISRVGVFSRWRVWRFAGVHQRIPPAPASLPFRMNKDRKCAKMPAPGQFLYNHIILKLVLVPSHWKGFDSLPTHTKCHPQN